MVIATDGYSRGLLPELEAAVHQPTRGQVIVTDPLGHANVMGLACGELVAQAILGRPAPELQLFSFSRLL